MVFCYFKMVKLFKEVNQMVKYKVLILIMEQFMVSSIVMVRLIMAHLINFKMVFVIKEAMTFN